MLPESIDRLPESDALVLGSPARYAVTAEPEDALDQARLL